MYLFGLEGNNFVISLGLLLLISGAIMFYCLKRFAILETTILEQGRILHSFINRMQERENNFTPYTQTAGNIAINSVNEKLVFMNDNANTNTNTNTNTNDDKIEVSDNDSSSEYDSDDTDDSADDTVDDIVDDIVDDKVDTNDYIEELNNDDKVDTNEDSKLELVENNNVMNDLNNDLLNDSTVKIISIEDIQPDILNASNILNINQSDSESDLDSSTNLDTNSIIDDEHLNVLNIEETIVNEVNNEIKKGGITKMKVSELRELVLQNGLVDSSDDANKLKKENLIKMLQDSC
jgi:hypothetical protein